MPIPLRTRDGLWSVQLSAEIQYTIDRDDDYFRVRNTAYAYRLVDREQREVLTFHWHPTGISSVTHPHIHLSGRLPTLDLGPGSRSVALGDLHIPTGPITLTDIVRLLIVEFGVAPRRPAWAAILEEHPDPFASPG